LFLSPRRGPRRTCPCRYPLRFPTGRNRPWRGLRGIEMLRMRLRPEPSPLGCNADLRVVLAHLVGGMAEAGHDDIDRHAVLCQPGCARMSHSVSIHPFEAGSLPDLIPSAL